MGRLSKSASNARPNFRVQYRKLVDENRVNRDILNIIPTLRDYLSYCCNQCGHTQKLQAEELNSIVGNAFRMAYAAQLQKQPSFQNVIASQLDQTEEDKVLWAKELKNAITKNNLLESEQLNNISKVVKMEVHISNNDNSNSRLSPPNSIPGLKTAHKYNVFGPTSHKNQSQQSTPSSDESNSPTEMNSYKRMAEKPPLIKRLAMGFSTHLSTDDDSWPLVNNDGSVSSTPGSPGSPTTRPTSRGYVNEIVNKDSQNKNGDILINGMVINDNAVPEKSPLMNEEVYKSHLSSSGSSSCSQNGGEVLNFAPAAPPLPERLDSLNNKELGELRLAPWFQAGIPREIALEILGQEPIGSFMVRDSTTKPGCFALSLRVPRTFHPTGIAHYLIVQTNKGYKIKGFTKEFSTLISLITHHSVMPELLPCPLSLSRYNPSFPRSNSKKDFADVDLDSDYNTLADFRKMMADINI